MFVRKLQHPKPTTVFDTYWRFAAERQAIYYRRLAGEPQPWTADPILQKHRFTNAYRVTDRVSQYLIRRVIASGSQEPQELVFRVLLFKLFNRISTWELLERQTDLPTWADYRYETYDRALSQALDRSESIYSAAYIMANARRFGEKRKHQNHLRLIERMMSDDFSQRVTDAPTLAHLVRTLRSYPSIGVLLSYQLATDLNYAGVCEFDEMDYVLAGPGARDGIAKCFSSLGDLDEEGAIRWAADTQVEQFERLGLSFRDLWGRPLQLIDCQNVFCEVDKYARVAHPEYAAPSGRTRIKQQFSPRGPISLPTLPAKWNVAPSLG